MGDEAATWVGRRAVAWVIDEAPVPADLAFTLTVVARRCDDDGRGSYQSLKTIAEKVGKSEAQAARDLRRLRDLGLLLLGDQSLPEKHGVPRGKRPTVYDVPLGVKGPKPVKGSKNPSGLPKSAEPEFSTPPRMEAPPASKHPLHPSPLTPCMDATPTPCMDASAPPASMHPKEDMNKTGNKTSISRGAAERTAARFLRSKFGDGLTDYVVASVIDQGYGRARRAGKPTENIDRYLRGWADEHLVDVIYAAQEAEKAPSPPAEPEERLPLALVHDRPVSEAVAAAAPALQPPILVAVPDRPPADAPPWRRQSGGQYEADEDPYDAETGLPHAAADAVNRLRAQMGWPRAEGS